MVDVPEILRNILLRSVELGKRMRDDAKQAKDLIEKLERSTDYRSVLLRESRSTTNFLEKGKAFAQAVLTWASEYPEVLKQYKNVLGLVITELNASGFVVERMFPAFSITFDQRKFDLMLEAEAEGHHVVKPSPAQKVELERKENKLIIEIAEIIALDFGLEKALEDIENELTVPRAMSICERAIQAQRVDGQFIDDLNVIATTWQRAAQRLGSLRRQVYTAIELDDDAAKRLKQLTRETKTFGLNQKQLHAAVGALKMLGKFALDMVPGGNFINYSVDLYENRALYRDALRELREED